MPSWIRLTTSPTPTPSPGNALCMTSPRSAPRHEQPFADECVVIGRLDLNHTAEHAPLPILDDALGGLRVRLQWIDDGVVAASADD